MTFKFNENLLQYIWEKQLFDKKTEGVALQYLLENLPFVLEGDNHCQSILHETLKFYMRLQGMISMNLPA